MPIGNGMLTRQNTKSMLRREKWRRGDAEPIVQLSNIIMVYLHCSPLPFSQGRTTATTTLQKKAIRLKRRDLCASCSCYNISYRCNHSLVRPGTLSSFHPFILLLLRHARPTIPNPIHFGYNNVTLCRAVCRFTTPLIAPLPL